MGQPLCADNMDRYATLLGLKQMFFAAPHIFESLDLPCVVYPSTK